MPTQKLADRMCCVSSALHSYCTLSDVAVMCYFTCSCSLFYCAFNGRQVCMYLNSPGKTWIMEESGLGKSWKTHAKRFGKSWETTFSVLCAPWKITSNTLVALVETEQDCFKELFEAVNITCWISEFIWQWVPDRRTSNRKSPMAIRVESTARHNEPVSVGGT